MAFSLTAADEMGPCRTYEKGELALIECAPPLLVADHICSPEKERRFLEPIDSVVTEHPLTSGDFCEPISRHLATA
jgi:hypothetical protein